MVGRWCTPGKKGSHLSLSLRIRVWHPNTRIYVRLLGPCFQTGGRKPFCQHREPSNYPTALSTSLSHRQNFVLSRARASRNTGMQKRVIIPLSSPTHRTTANRSYPEEPSTTNLTDADQPALQYPQHRMATQRKNGTHRPIEVQYSTEVLVSCPSLLTISSTF